MSATRKLAKTIPCALAACGAAILSTPPARAAAPRKAQDALYAIYSSPSASTAAKYHAWRLLRRKNPSLLRPLSFHFGTADSSTASIFIVAAKGGSLTRADRTSIVLPPGALASNLLLTISTAAARSDLETTVRARKMDAVGLVSVSSGAAFGPEGALLKTPATIVLPYDIAKLQAEGLSSFDMQIYRWNIDKQTWDWMRTTDNPNGTVTAQVTRLSVYEALARKRR